MLFLVRVLLSTLSILCAAARNVTIDDANGDEITGQPPIYIAGTQGANCTVCALRPNSSEAFDHTWHDSTYAPTLRPGPIPTITLLFKGTAIYVFSIVPTTSPPNSDIVTGMQLIFTLDDQPAGQFAHEPDNGSTINFAYSFPVYVNESLATLPSVQHNLTIQSLMVNLFDYAIYTTPDEDMTTTTLPTTTLTSSTIPSSELTGTASLKSARHTPIGAVVGGAVGGTLAFAALLLFAFTYRRCSGNHVRHVVTEETRFNTDSLARRIEPFNGTPVTTHRVIGLHKDPDGTGDPQYGNSIIPLTLGGSAEITTSRWTSHGWRKHTPTPTHTTPTSLPPDRGLQAQMRELRAMVEQVQIRGQSLQISRSITEPLPDYDTAVRTRAWGNRPG
ncbi:hypothetical protein AcW1_002910 [Taiwanofungus camphoratus]|nr:hypothetical protein AcW1_002910 [Antrodia cinnamomea]